MDREILPLEKLSAIKLFELKNTRARANKLKPLGSSENSNEILLLKNKFALFCYSKLLNINCNFLRNFLKKLQ